MSSWSVSTRSAEETRQFGRLFGERAAPGMILLLNGPLGAGKTCFAQGVARGLAVPEQTPVTSPSYTLLNVHSGRLELYHFDLYRLTRVDDLEDLGYDEYAEGGGLTLVEWADRLQTPLPASLIVEIQISQDEQRRFRITAGDAAGQRLLAAVKTAREEGELPKNL